MLGFICENSNGLYLSEWDQVFVNESIGTALSGLPPTNLESFERRYEGVWFNEVYWLISLYMDRIYHHSRYHFRYAPSQWETSLHCNDVSHWLGAYLNWSLSQYHVILLWKYTVSIMRYFNIWSTKYSLSWRFLKEDTKRCGSMKCTGWFPCTFIYNLSSQLGSITSTQVMVYHWWIPCETLVHTGSR